jgi:Ca2+:H+ antiporter
VRNIFTSWLDFLLIFVPVTVVLEVLRVDPLLIFASAGLAIIPLAGLLGRATEHLTSHVGAGIGALLNASLGNAAELIIALVALREGLHDVVKASLTGSIIGNILLVLGAAMFAGGLKYERQKFNQTAAGMGVGLLLLSAVGLIIPALFHFTAGDRGVELERGLSLTISIILFIIYIASLLFSLKTHRHLFAGDIHNASDLGERPWTRGASIVVLTVVACLVGLMSKILVGTLESASHQLGLTQVFVGVILVALVGNAAAHSSLARCAGTRIFQLSLRSAVGSDFHTVRSGRSDDFGSECGIRGDGRRIKLDGRRHVGRSVCDAGDRLFLSTRLATGSPLVFSAPVKRGVCEPVGCSGLFGLSRLFG